MLSGLFGKKQNTNNQKPPTNGGGWFGKKTDKNPETLHVAEAYPVEKVKFVNNSRQIKIAIDYFKYIVKLNCIFNKIKNNSYNCPSENNFKLNFQMDNYIESPPASAPPLPKINGSI